MTPATPPVLYISADTSDLTTRYKATPRMHMGADAWVPKETLDALRQALEKISVAKPFFAYAMCGPGGIDFDAPGSPFDRGKAEGYEELQAIARAALSALAALPAPDEGEQEEGE